MISLPGESSDERDDDPQPAPTPEEIRERAAAIRKHWSQKKRKRRSVHPDPAPWFPPGINVEEIKANERQPDNN